jgi:hypothetical protein
MREKKRLLEFPEFESNDSQKQVGAAIFENMR